MTKHPLHYNKENLDEILNKPLKIGIGESNSEEVSETIEGQIVKCTLASNPPHLPAIVSFETSDGTKREFNFFEIIQIEIL